MKRNRESHRNETLLQELEELIQLLNAWVNAEHTCEIELNFLFFF